MAKVIESNMGAAAISFGLNRYGAIAGNATTNTATEANTQVKMRTAGTFSDLGFFVVTNTLNASSTVTFRKNTADGSQTLSVNAAATGHFTDATNTDTIVSTDLVGYRLNTTASASGSITTSGVFSVFSATTNTTQRWAVHGVVGPSTTSATEYIPLASAAALNTTEANAEYKLHSSGTLANLFVFSQSNGRSTATTVTVRKNNADGNGTFSIPGSTSGTFEDIVNTDSVVANDVITLKSVTSTGSGTIFLLPAIDFTSTDSKSYLLSASTSATGVSQNINQTRYLKFGGGLILSDTTDSAAQQTSRFAFTASHLNIYLSANTVTATSTLRSRVNTANGNQSVSITASTTGRFEDTTNSDTIASGALINAQIVIGATGTSLTARTLGMLCTVASAAAPVRRFFPGLAR